MKERHLGVYLHHSEHFVLSLLLAPKVLNPSIVLSFTFKYSWFFITTISGSYYSNCFFNFSVIYTYELAGTRGGNLFLVDPKSLHFTMKLDYFKVFLIS